jgi:hypothetical protein
MVTRRFAQALAATACILGIALTAGIGSANATPEDDQFLDVVKQLNIPVEKPEDAILVGQQICKAVADGQLEPARTVRSVIGKLTAEGLEKGQATHLVWGAVSIYCPKYSSLVGR